MLRVPALKLLAAALACASLAPAPGADQPKTLPPQSAPAAQPERFDPHQYTWRYEHKTVRYPSIALPIRQAELDYCTWILRLSDAQVAQLDRQYDLYLSDNFALRKVEEAAIYELADLGPEAGMSLEQAADRAIRMLQARNRLVSRLNALDVAFFDALSATLAEHQLSRLPHIRELRNRIVASSAPCRHPGGNFDIEIRALELLRSHDDPPSAFDDCSVILHQYSASATVLWERQQHAFDNTRVAYIKVRPSFSAPVLDDKQRAAIDRHDRMRDMNADLEIRRYELNAQYIGLVADAMPPPFGADLRMQFQFAAYPPVYPNPFDASRVCAAALSAAGESAELSAAIQSLNQQYTSDLSVLDRKLIDRYLVFLESILRLPSQDVHRDQRYMYDMDQLQLKRRHVAQRYVDTATSLLSTLESDGFLQALIDWQDAAAAHRPSESGLYYIP